VPNLRLLERAGISEIPFIALVLGEGISVLLVIGAAAYFIRHAVFSTGKRLRSTRYLITNRRVLIQQGREELHLDREKIVDVIPLPSRGGLSDVFLVLDGPRARAVATSGAFGEMERGPDL